METKIQAGIQNTHVLIGMSPNFEIVSIFENYPGQLYTFFPRTIIHWNALPHNIPILPTMTQFITAVCQVVHSVP